MLSKSNFKDCERFKRVVICFAFMRIRLSNAFKFRFNIEYEDFSFLLQPFKGKLPNVKSNAQIFKQKNKSQKEFDD